ncbi:DUF2971 domain-containing protein [Rhodococcus jostii]|uniref:DUF2971 domain-containing protein n=1 Tax=Rhodococcus jostii TaxID=132919 RepID=A0A1H4IQZ7_RHOJO|nr:DUF2971 domain-containing protein [Rhodococcus jostii]SEB36470.1 Protein of unknown function [Rhodococcus jostii]
MHNEDHDDDILYHYTSTAGLLGILSPVGQPSGWDAKITTTAGSFSLWATDVVYLNDTKELQYGRKQLLRELRAPVAPGSAMDGTVTWLEGVLGGHLDDPFEVASDIYGPDRLNFYAACFCEDGDLLSQWRGYGSDKGYAIGFRKSALEGMIRRAGHPLAVMPVDPLSPVTRLRKVEYGDAAQILQDAAKTVVANEMTDQEAMQLCLEALAQVKSPAFASEREWRLFDLDRQNYTPCEYRVGPTGITPYVRLMYFAMPGMPAPIVNVRVGPGADMELRSRAAEQLLRQRGFGNVEVIPSRISYRG